MPILNPLPQRISRGRRTEAQAIQRAQKQTQGVAERVDGMYAVIDDLRRDIDHLTVQLESRDERINFLARRIGQLEQRKKPGPKPKNDA